MRKNAVYKGLEDCGGKADHLYCRLQEPSRLSVPKYPTRTCECINTHTHESLSAEAAPRTGSSRCVKVARRVALSGMQDEIMKGESQEEGVQEFLCWERGAVGVKVSYLKSLGGSLQIFLGTPAVSSAPAPPAFSSCPGTTFLCFPREDNCCATAPCRSLSRLASWPINPRKSSSCSRSTVQLHMATASCMCGPFLPV